MKISIVSGGFDLFHSGHLAYIEGAAKLGNEIWVCLNSDERVYQLDIEYFFATLRFLKRLQ